MKTINEIDRSVFDRHSRLFLTYLTLSFFLFYCFLSAYKSCIALFFSSPHTSSQEVRPVWTAHFANYGFEQKKTSAYAPASNIFTNKYFTKNCEEKCACHKIYILVKYHPCYTNTHLDLACRQLQFPANVVPITGNKFTWKSQTACTVKKAAAEIFIFFTFCTHTSFIRSF